MKKHGIGSRLLALLLVLAMVLPLVPMQAEAAKGELANVSTGLVNNTIDTNDTISLPIQILDYDADGMLFEYAESKDILTSGDFDATWCATFTGLTSSSTISTSNFGNFWSDVTVSINTSNAYASYIRAAYNETTSANGGCYYGRSSVITPNDLGGAYGINTVRYLVLVYRSNVTSGNIGFWVERESAKTRTDSKNRVGDLAFTNKGDDGEGSATNWTYAVYDLKQGNLADTWLDYGAPTAVFTTLPMDASGEYIDIAHIALFGDPDKAKAFGEYMLTDGSNRGDNRGFGLLRSSRNQSGTDAFASIVDWDTTNTVVQLNTYNTKYDDNGNVIPNEVDFSTVSGLGYTLLGTFAENGIANVGLLEDTLVNGKPVYKQEVVNYLALLLQSTLPLAERTTDGWKEYRYIGSELADKLRARITGGLGTYPTGTKAAGLIGTWDQCQGNISTYYDAAYFLLNSIFIDNSYNTPQDTVYEVDENGEIVVDENGNAVVVEERETYDYLILSAGIDSDTGDKVYVFDGGFSTSSDPTTAEMAIDYNTTTHTIQNTSAAGKAHFFYQWWTSTNTGDTTTLNPFLPITDKNTADGQTKTPYWQDDGVVNIKKETQDTLVNRDYNFAMYSSGEFVYHADDELFFDFEGDDDVYLFINNTLVMDIGSAHSIDGVRFELNDYVEKAKAGELASAEQNKNLALVEGDTYNFNFFYMERHSYGSNMRINTNIKVTDPSMSTEKTAYVDGVQVEYGGIVNADSIVEYGFSISNSGSENLYNIGFADNDIGVTLDPTNGLTITGDRVYSLDGTHLEPGNTAHRDKLVTELTAVLSGKNDVTGQVYDPITVTFDSNDALKAFLTDIKSDAALESGGGLWRGSTVAFRGVGYKLSAEQIQSGWFDNTVFATATNKTKSKSLKSQDTMRVCVPSDPMYYQWAGHDLQISLDKLIADVLAAATQEGNVLAGKVPSLEVENVTNLVEVTRLGYGTDHTKVTIDTSNFTTTVNYSDVGSHVFYLKVWYTVSGEYKNVVVPVVVNVTDVQPSVFVLDYGLKADLTENGGAELFKNDTLSVPGRDTASTILAMGTDGAYSPNEITFTEETDGVVEAADGTFTFTKDTQKLIFTPSDFMEDTYKTQIAVNVYETDITPSKITGTLNINSEVEMYKDITVLPATVVYYEDCFPAIHYIGAKTQTNTFEALGSQSVDQEENYGHDDYYEDDTAVSADSLTTITIDQMGPVAYFTFQGTGFELISRTNAYDSATIYMAVFDDKVDAAKITFNKNDGCYYDDAGNKLEPVKNIPVITEFDNGANGGEEEIYQVPVIRVDDLALATYNVVICGIPAYDWSQSTYPDDMVVIPTNLYVDGLRIFRPIGATNDNYTADENGAAFTEIRDLIVDGKAAVATYTGTAVTVSTGTTTWTENRNGVYYDGSTYEGNVVNSVNDYLLYGPNNEVYMDGAFSDTALAFQVTESGTGTHALQVAIHAVNQGLFYGAGDTGMHAPVYYATAAGTWQLLDTITSGVEMYYTIDYTKCPVANGAYQIILKVDIGEDYTTAMASYTTIKTVGLDISNISGTGDATDLAYENGILIDTTTGEMVEPASYPAFELLGKMLSTSVMAAPEQPKPADPFVDAEEGSFYYDAMLWAVENGITNGTSATTFSPGKQVSRAETVTFLWRAAGQPEPTIVKNPFVDVSANDFYYKAVLWAVENGITNGMDATHFGPYAICNRAQVVTFLWRAAGEPAHETAENPFRDAEVGSFYYDAMLWAVENGITNGIDANNFGPAANCNRAQIVTFLYRAQ